MDLDNQMRFIFVDWLHLQQDYIPDKPLKIINGSIITKIEESGELAFQILGFRNHVGSFDTLINVKCDGFRIEISGNPSRFGRLDNLFGHDKLHTSFDLYNKILNSLGLPSMTKGKAIIKRIDITENVIVGKGNEQEHIRMLSSCVYNGELARLYPDFNTCTWFESSKRLIIKAYNKAHELKRHLKKYAIIEGVTARELQYINELIKQSEQLGIVRVEVGFRKKLLKDLGLELVKRRETMGDLIQLFENRNPYNQKINYSLSGSQDIKNKAIDLGFTKRQASNIRDYYDLYLTGVDFKQRCESKPSYYRICSLMKKVGVDVRKPLDITRLQHVMKPLEYQFALPSDSYLDFVPNLRYIGQD